jgi:hypothetical protein
MRSLPPLALLLSLAISCCTPFSGSEPPLELHVLSWNVLSLFDAVEDGTEYADFSISRGTWGETRYRNRLALLGKAILASRKGGAGRPPGPDVACLIEIEKERVLADLVEGPLAAGRYRYRSFAKAPGSAIGLGIVSRLPIKATRAWGLSLGSRSERPILEARFDAGGKDLSIFLCHWKSKLEGAEVTEPARREAARLLSSLVAARQVEDPEGALVVCGDFNENPDEYARTGRRYPTAFMPARSAAAAGAPGEPCILLGDRKETAAGGSALFSPWSESDAYSYVHRGIKERIDGFLVVGALFDGKGLEYRDFYAWDEGLVDGEGRPLPWSNSTGTGCSDHLPIVLGLVAAGDR